MTMSSDTDSERTLVADGFVFLEAPRWHDGRLWVSDVFDEKLYSIDPDGTRSLICDVPGKPLGIGFLSDGTMLVAAAGQRKLMKVENGQLSTYADLSELAGGDVNDLVVDDSDRVYIGNFGYDAHGGAPVELADLHAIEPDGTIGVAATGLEFPNGTIIKNEGRTLVVAETWAGRLTAFDRAPDGSLSNRRIYADLKHRQPDGICVDDEGGIWVSCYNTGEFIRVLDGGEITDRHAFDGRAISCVLGGEDRKTLYCSVFHGSDDEAMAKRHFGALHAVKATVAG